MPATCGGREMGGTQRAGSDLSRKVRRQTGARLSGSFALPGGTAADWGSAQRELRTPGKNCG